LVSATDYLIPALEEAGLKIVGRVSIQVEEPEQAGAYLRTKKEKLGHLLDFSTG
jgi:GTP cyclohydrolase II